MDEVEQRLVDFAVRVIKLAAYVPQTQAGQHLAEQLLRSGTAPAAHYVAGRCAGDSSTGREQFVLCLQQLHMTRLWLTLITKADLLTSIQLENITAENDELCRLFSASLDTGDLA